jgi:O-antigen ligase
MAFVASGLIAMAMLLTFSRGAWSGQAVALLLVVMAGSRAARHAVLTFGLGGVCLMAALWPLIPPEFSERLASVATSAVDLGSLADEAVTPENWAVLERLSQWYAGWQMFINNPILGVGIGNYDAAYDTYRLDQWPVGLGHAHNHYLTIAAEAGFFGLVAYLGFLVVAFRSGISAHQKAQDAMGKALAVGILGSLAAFATHNMFDVLFVHGMGVTVGLLLALLEGIPRGMEDNLGQDTKA